MSLVELLLLLQAADAVGYAGSVTMMQCLSLLATPTSATFSTVGPRNPPGADLLGAFDRLVHVAAPLSALVAAVSAMHFSRRVIGAAPYAPVGAEVT